MSRTVTSFQLGERGSFGDDIDNFKQEDATLSDEGGIVLTPQQTTVCIRPRKTLPIHATRS